MNLPKSLSFIIIDPIIMGPALACTAHDHQNQLAVESKKPKYETHASHFTMETVTSTLENILFLTDK